MVTVRFQSLQGDVPEGLSPGSHVKIVWTCDCGRQVARAYKEVARGRSKNCGRCNWLTVEKMASSKFNSLQMKDPVEVAPRSSKQFMWVCDCGQETLATMQDVFTGHTKSCGRCGLYGRVAPISAADMATRRFEHLRMKTPEEIMPGSHRKVVWVCDCGREKAIDINSVVLGKSKSCGRCTDFSSAEMSVRKFGHLKMKNPVDTPPSSGKKVAWVCDCGAETSAMVAHVVSGHTSSCGRCLLSYQTQQKLDTVFRSLQTPIEPSQMPIWAPIALETVKKHDAPFSAQCRLCGRRYKPRWGDIRQGKSLSCGCSTSRVSSGQKELAEFIAELGFDVKLEHAIGRLKYDVCVPLANLVIEYAGLWWHSFPDSKERDLAKRRNALENGLRHVMIYEDEWACRKPQMKNFIRNLLGLNRPTSLRPSRCDLRPIGSQQADLFYGKFHYIGACRAKINYGMFFKEKLVACCSFKRPTRQSKHDWELVRMASDSEFRAHGAWSKILKQFVFEFGPASIVSFSDNRLFDGRVYGKAGFQLDGNVKPSRYWWKNKRRFHQSALRKPKGEARTESELRRSQGYGEIWDLGKKRWVWSATPALNP
jgi:hypothetical protein